jgi:hypothetical protein
MTFSNFIKSLVEQTSYDFGRGERDWQNFISDNQINPAVYLDDPISFNFVSSTSGAITRTYDLKLVIFHKSQLDWTPEQHDEVVELAEIEARKLIILINNSDSVKDFISPNCLQFHNLFDSNVSGVFLTGKITFRENSSICVNAIPQSDFVQLSNTNDEWQRTVPNGSSYIVPNTPVELVDSEGTVIETVNIPSVSGGQIVVTVGGSITVNNSNDTYIETSSINFTLPDTNLDIYVDGILQESTTFVTLDNSTEINIIL